MASAQKKTVGGSIATLIAEVSALQAADATLLTGANTWSGANTYSARQIFTVGTAADNSALLLGGGTSAAPSTTAVANSNFLEFRGESTATDAGSDTRCAYLRLYLAGATTGGGDCLRAFTTVSANLANARGAHISLNFTGVAGAMECSGEGTAVKGTLHIPNVASWAPTGTYSAGMFEIYSDGSDSDPAGMTSLSVLTLANSGDATGAADVDTDANILSIQGFTAASGVTNAISSTALAEIALDCIGLRIKVGTGLYRLIAIPEAEWN